MSNKIPRVSSVTATAWDPTELQTSSLILLRWGTKHTFYSWIDFWKYKKTRVWLQSNDIKIDSMMSVWGNQASRTCYEWTNSINVFWLCGFPCAVVQLSMIFEWIVQMTVYWLPLPTSQTIVRNISIYRHSERMISVNLNCGIPVLPLPEDTLSTSLHSIHSLRRGLRHDCFDKLDHRLASILFFPQMLQRRIWEWSQSRLCKSLKENRNIFDIIL